MALLRRIACALPAGVLAAAVGVAAPVTTLAPPPTVRHATIRVADRPLQAPFAFRMLGASWNDERDVGSASVRTLGSAGWSPWTKLWVDDAEGPDDGSHERGRRVASRPLWVGRATTVQVRGARAGMRLHLVDPGEGPARPRMRAAADPSAPSVITREQWGADESIRRGSPEYAPRIRLGFVHHTATGNDYGPQDSAAFVRAIYEYHVNTNGWDDIGYNALIDQYGQIFEGRYGGLDRPVVGAHAQGFNTGSAGVAIIGTFTDVDPPSASIDALQRFLAWRLDVDRVDPRGTATVRSGGSPKFPEGTDVTLPTVLGHRDTGDTECPGDLLYPRLPSIREAVNAIGGPKLYEPALPTAAITPNGDGDADTARFTATLSRQLEWRADLVSAAGTVVRRLSGFSRAVDVTWDGRSNDDVAQPVGDYTLRVSAWDGPSSVRPWTATVQVATLGGSGQPSAGPATGRYTPLAPARILDTRTPGLALSGKVGPGRRIDLPVAGQGGVPATGATAATLNVTVTGPTEQSYLTLFPSDGQRPLASNLNFSPSQTVAQLVTVELSRDGRVAIYNASGSVDVVVDVAGWYGARTGSDGRLQPLVPARIVDTRDGTGVPAGKLGAGRTLDVQVAGRGNVPAGGASAVVLNVTVTNPTEQSYLTLFPSDQEPPQASNINFAGATTIANRAAVKIGPDGRIKVYNASGTVDVVLDVNAWFTDASQADGPSGLFAASSPVRILDTRSGTGGYSGSLGPGDRMDVQVAGRGGTPVQAASAVVLSVTATSPTEQSYLTVYPAAQTLPLASDLNFGPDRTVPNHVVAKLGTDGRVSIYNPAGRVEVVVDVAGWYGR